MTREQIDQTFRDFDNVLDTFLGEYLMPASTPRKERACYACKRRVYISHYLKNGGTEKQWNDDRVQILCCACLNLPGAACQLEALGRWYISWG
jgi:hypothetical protein